MKSINGFANIVLVAILATLIATGVTIAVVNYRSNTEAATTNTPAPVDQKSQIITIIRTAFESYSGPAELRDSKYVTPKLAKYLDDYSKNIIGAAYELVLCAQGPGTAARSYEVTKISDNTASAITNSTDSGETGVDLVRMNGQWKMDVLTCIPSSAQ